MLFPFAEYYIEGEGVVNKVTLMLRAKLNGKYPYLTAVVNGNGRVKPGLAMVKGG